jgi:hypothetical protein
MIQQELVRWHHHLYNLLSTNDYFSLSRVQAHSQSPLSLLTMLHLDSGIIKQAGAPSFTHTLPPPGHWGCSPG